MSGLRLRRIKWKRPPAAADISQMQDMIWRTGQSAFSRENEWAFTVSDDPCCYMLPDGDGWKMIHPMPPADLWMVRA